MEHQLVRTSLSFDGIDDYVQIDGLSQDSIFTVSLWFNYESLVGLNQNGGIIVLPSML